MNKKVLITVLHFNLLTMHQTFLLMRCFMQCLTLHTVTYISVECINAMANWWCLDFDLPFFKHSTNQLY